MSLQYFYFSALGWIRERLDREQGQDLAEYAITLGIMAVAVLLAVIALGGRVVNIYNAFNTALSGS